MRKSSARDTTADRGLTGKVQRNWPGPSGKKNGGGERLSSLRLRGGLQPVADARLEPANETGDGEQPAEHHQADGAEVQQVQRLDVFRPTQGRISLQLDRRDLDLGKRTCVDIQTAHESGETDGFGEHVGDLSKHAPVPVYHEDDRE